VWAPYCRALVGGRRALPRRGAAECEASRRVRTEPTAMCVETSNSACRHARPDEGGKDAPARLPTPAVPVYGGVIPSRPHRQTLIFLHPPSAGRHGPTPMSKIFSSWRQEWSSFRTSKNSFCCARPGPRQPFCPVGRTRIVWTSGVPEEEEDERDRSTGLFQRVLLSPAGSTAT
jgi:hypothetical protein